MSHSNLCYNSPINSKARRTPCTNLSRIRSFPVKLIDGFVNNRSEIPDFLKEDEEMIARLNEINELFHQLFLTIECKFDYIGKQFPDKIEQLRELYHPLADDLLAKYSNKIELKIEPFIL